MFKNDAGQWIVEYLFDTPPPHDMLSLALNPVFDMQGMEPIAPAIEPVEADQDWLSICYRALPAFSVGKFYVYGSHCEDGVPDGYTGLLIDAVQAFGSGSHGTTFTCLQLLQDLAEDASFQPRAILDMGTGSGILAIGAAYLWPDSNVVASDIEPESAAAAARHAATNHVTERITCIHADGFADATVTGGAPYDLVIANILPAVLKPMADDLIAHGRDDAFILLSGIRNEQAQDVLDHYVARGCGETARLSRDGWTSLLLRRGA